MRKIVSKGSVLLSGTIAYREHKKWTENAVPLANNPYSKENIERRLSKSAKSDNSEQSPYSHSR